MIPRAIEYSLPTNFAMPQDRVSWTLDPSRAALLIHDMQEHFVAAYQEDAEPLRSVRANIAALLDAARRTGIPVFYTAQPSHQSPQARGLLNDMWGPGIGENTPATAVIPDLAPTNQDTILTKWRYDAFERSDFRERLEQAGRDQLIITGIYAHIGCQATAVRAFMLDVQPFFVADAVADFSYEQHVAALELIADCAGVTTTTTDVLGGIGGQSALTSHTPQDAQATQQAPAIQTDDHSPAFPVSWSHLVAQLSEATGTDPDHITPGSDLSSLGLDSVRLMALADAWSTSTGVLGFTDLILCDTPGDVAVLLERVHGVRFDEFAKVTA